MWATFIAVSGKRKSMASVEEGSVAVLSGDAELGDESSVGGDVSVVSGDVEARGAMWAAARSAART